MAGHSHWAGIKHKKEVVDAKRGKLFSSLAKAISIAAKGNPDPQTNAGLRSAILQAKRGNMPKSRIDKAITGATKGTLEEVTYEAIGPHGSGFLIKVETDNKNRTLGELKLVLKKNNGQLGTVSWMFKGTSPTYPLKLAPLQASQVEKLKQAILALEEVVEVYTNL